MTVSTENAETPQRFSKAERRVTLIAILIVFILAALDETVVSTAMPRIVAQLAGLDLYAWITTAYLLASTVMVPIYGKLSDIHGRKPVLVASILLFVIGSGLCGLAGEFGPLPLLGSGMVQLILFRTLQGLGGAGLITSASTVMADLYEPRERAKLSGLFGAVFMVASVIGPLVGGALTDLGTLHLLGLAVEGWRWVFYINLPLAGLALFMVLMKTPRLLHRTGGRIDLAGAVLLLATFIPFLLALSFGSELGWASGRILGLFTVSAASLAGFLAVEARSPNPILSLSLLRNRTFATANLAGSLMFMAFMGLVAFLPLYMQLGQGVAATVSGLTMLPLTFGLIVSATLSGLVVHRIGRYRTIIVGGAGLTALAAFLLTFISPSSSSLDIAWRVALLGLGLGPAQSLFNLAVQNAVDRSEIGIATSAGQFFRQVGATIGVAIFGAVLTHNLIVESAHAAHEPGQAVQSLSLADLQRIAGERDGQRRGPGGADRQVAEQVTDAVRGVVFAGALVSLLALAATLAVPELPLKSAPRAEKPDEASSEAAVASG